MRRFKLPWSAERIAGGYVVKDATGQALAYVYARETRALPTLPRCHANAVLGRLHSIVLQTASLHRYEP